MAETHYVAGGAAGVDHVDDHFFRRYRQLLDAEDAAFDELEHAYEDGDLAAWHTAIHRRTTFLELHGLSASPLPV
jgi:hypothetical protein